MPHTMKLKRLGIDTHQESTIYMRADCHVCRSEGFTAQSRVQVATDRASIIATLNVVHDSFVKRDEAGLSEGAWRLLGAEPGQLATLSHPRTVESLGLVRAKIYGHRFAEAELLAILEDIAGGRYADIDLAAFMTACAAGGMSVDETVALTRGMVNVGERLTWDRAIVADKHCVGGLPGNRTTPIVVAIVAAAGACIPKTSSRAITSPAGTADAMEMLAPVDLDLAAMRRVVDREGGCVVWGGAVGLSPVDDVLIRVERALDLDSDAQLVASVLSKKVAAGSSHVVIDIPMGPTAKVRTPAAANALAQLLDQVAQRSGLRVRTVITDGSQPVGRGIGPALEARDVLMVLQNDQSAPDDLRARAVRLAAETIELAGACRDGQSLVVAEAILKDGRAWRKLQAICEAQGGMRTPSTAPHRREVPAPRNGVVARIDNRRLARTAKLAGAPAAAAAGIDLHVRLGARTERGQPLFTLHAETPGRARLRERLPRIPSGHHLHYGGAVSRLVLALPGNEALAARIGELADIPVGAVEARSFPDGETYLRVQSDCDRRAIVLACTLDRPDRKVLPLIFLAAAARDLGASRVGLVAPYLAYLRQDRQFKPGEAVTSRAFGGLLSRYVDWLVTVDPHLHRYHSLSEIYAVPNRIVHAAPALADWIRSQVDRPVLVGPDEESAQWVADVGERAGAPYLALRKVRHGDRAVEVSPPDVDAHRHRTPVVVDDIVSSARTMIETVKHLLAAGLRPPVCVGVHALFSEHAEEALRAAGAARIVTTSSVSHPTNAIDIVPLLVPAVRELAR